MATVMGGIGWHEQIVLYPEEPKPRKSNNERRRWENGFQRWSNEQAQDERTSIGVCGFGAMCDYCTDNHYGRPCVRALNAMCREKRISIDYQKQKFADAWEGDFCNG